MLFDDIFARELLPGNVSFRILRPRKIGPDDSLNVTFDFQLSVPTNGIFPNVEVADFPANSSESALNEVQAWAGGAGRGLKEDGCIINSTRCTLHVIAI